MKCYEAKLRKGTNHQWNHHWAATVCTLDFIPDKDGMEAGRPLGRLYSDVLGWSSDQGGRGAKELDYDSVLTVGLLQLWVLLLSLSASFLLAVPPLAIPGG